MHASMPSPIDSAGKDPTPKGRNHGMIGRCRDDTWKIRFTLAVPLNSLRYSRYFNSNTHIIVIFVT
jgi:hypothetical protein